MRPIGALPDEREAKKFGDFLYAIGIENEVEAGEDSDWNIWVVSEEELDRAAQLLEEFRRDPTAPRYERARSQAQARRAQALKSEAAARKRQVNVAERMRWSTGSPAPFTFALIGVSVAVAIATHLGQQEERIAHLLITATPGVLNEIRAGEVWRLVTPIFVHFGFLHIVFNMLWLNELGGMVERRSGPVSLVGLVLLFAIPSNLAQYYVAGPFFGGMSGVVYGLLAYAWLRGRLEPSSGLYVRGNIMAMMMVWYFLSLAGILGPIANTAHTGGLVVGAACAALVVRVRRMR